MLNGNLPLTKMESEFAAEHHALINTFLHTFDLPEDDFYDVAVFGYLSAVRAYLAQAEPCRESFRSVAYQAMTRHVRRSQEFWVRENHGVATESYREELHSQDLRDTVAEACETVLSFQTLADQLTHRQLRIAEMRIEGYCDTEIADRCRIDFHEVQEEFDRAQARIVVFPVKSAASAA